MAIKRPFPQSSMTSEYGDRKGRPTPHGGKDYGQKAGTAIKAGGAGVIHYNGWLNNNAGYVVTVRYDEHGLHALHCHLPSRGPLKAGTRVKEGDIIGVVGSSGNSSGPHLHLETYLPGGKRVNPDSFYSNLVVGESAPASGGSSIPGFDQTVYNQQVWLNASRNAGLDVDGRRGAKTIAKFKEYQTFLRPYGYTGNIDGDWGGGTQAAHEKFYAALTKPAPAAPGFPNVSVAILGQIGNVQGLQKIAKIGGYQGRIDNVWGPGSKAGFQAWLNRNAGGSVTAWLRGRWGYVGNDQMGPQMIAALQRANAENNRVL